MYIFRSKTTTQTKVRNKNVIVKVLVRRGLSDNRLVLFVDRQTDIGNRLTYPRILFRDKITTDLVVFNEGDRYL